MKTTQKQTGRQGTLRRFPKFSIPPELLVLREVRLLEFLERSRSLSRLTPIFPQPQRG
jgi:hypothetical protein